jgi:hypothetical protein
LVKSGVDNAFGWHFVEYSSVHEDAQHRSSHGVCRDVSARTSLLKLLVRKYGFTYHADGSYARTAVPVSLYFIGSTENPE